MTIIHNSHAFAFIGIIMIVGVSVFLYGIDSGISGNYGYPMQRVIINGYITDSSGTLLPAGRLKVIRDDGYESAEGVVYYDGVFDIKYKPVWVSRVVNRYYTLQYKKRGWTEYKDCAEIDMKKIIRKVPKYRKASRIPDQNDFEVKKNYECGFTV